MGFLVDLKKTQKRITIQLIKWFFGGIKTPTTYKGIPESIALLAQERFGDVIMMSPLIRMLKKTYPETEIYIISVNRIADYLKYDPNIKKVLKAKRPSNEDKLVLQANEFDILFNTKDHPSVTFLYLTQKIKAKHRVGIFHPEHQGFFHTTFNMPAIPQTTVKTYFALLDYLNISYSEHDQIPYLPEGPVSEDVQNFSKVIQGEEYLAINLSASQPYKEWPLQKWKKFLQQIKRPTFVIAMPKHLQEKLIIEETFDHVIPSPSTKSIFDAGHLIKNCRILVSPDTALVHIASCFNTPVLALYRQTLDLQNFPPFSEKNQVLMAPDLHISGISTSEVIKSFRELDNVI